MWPHILKTGFLEMLILGASKIKTKLKLSKILISILLYHRIKQSEASKNVKRDLTGSGKPYLANFQIVLTQCAFFFREQFIGGG